MRQLQINMKDRVAYAFNVESGLIYEDITDGELKSMGSNIKSNKSTYLTNYRKHHNDLITIKVRAEELRSQKNKNINTRAALNSEIANKKAELQITQDAIKDLKAQAEAAKLQIRNFESEINAKTVADLQPAEQALKNAVRSITGLQAQVTENKTKINNISLIDPNAIVTNYTRLAQLLTLFKNTYLSSDPYNVALTSFTKNLATRVDELPTIVA
jgi:DNA repair exonuclease SbcCD ATPase subunit